jgi:hypothetical protein
MPFWIFKANPDTYRIDERLLNPYPTLIWAVTRYHDRIKKGDTVFLWRGGTPRGICAVMTVDTCPYQPEAEDLNDGFEIPTGSLDPVSSHWAKCRIEKRIPLLESNIIKKIPGLELFSFFSAFQQAVNYSITRPEGIRLLEYIENRPAYEPVSKPAPAPKSAPKTVKSEVSRMPAVKQAKPASAVKAVELLKCLECGRFVVSTDIDRHVRENHAGLPVEWKKVK